MGEAKGSDAGLRPPTIHEIRQARGRIRSYLPETPFHSYPALDAILGFQAFVKHENVLPTGAFKVRGGVNLVSQLVKKKDAPRVVAGASTGNHGQSIAYAAKIFGLEAVVAVPQGANPGKVEAMQRMGARVEFQGADFDEARAWVEEHAAANGWRYVHSGNEPDLIAGVGTHTLEMLEQEPELDAIFVPVGGGSGAAGCCLAAQGLDAKAQVIGVQSSAAPAAYESWKTHAIASVPSATRADGLATGRGFELPQEILQRYLADFRLVSDDEIDAAVLLYLEKAHMLAEGAGAAALAAAYRSRDEWAGKRVGLVLSGGNMPIGRLRALLSS